MLSNVTPHFHSTFYNSLTICLMDLMSEFMNDHLAITLASEIASIPARRDSVRFAK